MAAELVLLASILAVMALSFVPVGALLAWMSRGQPAIEITEASSFPCADGDLVWLDRTHARGLWGERCIELVGTPSQLEVRVAGAPVDRDRVLALAEKMRQLAMLGHRVGPDARLWPVCGDAPLATSAARALLRLAGSEEPVLAMAVPSGADYGLVADLICWMAEQLGWEAEGDIWRLASEDECALVRLKAWEQLVGGWTPNEEPWSESTRAALDQGLQDEDPWIRALAAFHSGDKGLSSLRALLLDPKSPDTLLLWLIERVDLGLSSREWLSLFLREPELVHVATREAIMERAGTALAQTAGLEVMVELKAASRARTFRGRIARRSCEAIVARTQATGGRLSVTEATPGGALSLVERHSPTTTK
jgi:hypothetical protein